MECAILFGYSLCTQSSASRANRAACASSKSEAPIRPPHRISPATIDRIMNVSYPEFSFWTPGSRSVYPQLPLILRVAFFPLEAVFALPEKSKTGKSCLSSAFHKHFARSEEHTSELQSLR